MKSVLVFLVSAMLSWSAWSGPREHISIVTPYTPGHSGTAAMHKIIEEANQAQKKYHFVLESRPGGNQSIALNHINQSPQNQLAIIAASFVDNFQSGLVRRDLYVPVWSLGDACWAVYGLGGQHGNINSLRSAREITAGSAAIGNATHLTSLVIGEKFNIPVRFVAFKSANEALINMIGNNGVTFTIDRAENYDTFRSKNERLTLLAMSCPQRHPVYPEIPTLREQGFDTPYVFNTVVAHKDMDANKQVEIGEILHSATKTVGPAWILQSSGFVPPQFKAITAKQHLDKSVDLLIKLRSKYSKDLASDK